MKKHFLVLSLIRNIMSSQVQDPKTTQGSSTSQTAQSKPNTQLDLNFDFSGIPNVSPEPESQVSPQESPEQTRNDLDLKLEIPEVSKKNEIETTSGNTQENKEIDQSQNNIETNNKDVSNSVVQLENTETPQNNIALDLSSVKEIKKDDDRLKNEDNKAKEVADLQSGDTSNSTSPSSSTEPSTIGHSLDITTFPTETPNQVFAQFSETQPLIKEEVQPEKTNYLNIDNLNLNTGDSTIVEKEHNTTSESTPLQIQNQSLPVSPLSQTYTPPIQENISSTDTFSINKGNPGIDLDSILGQTGPVQNTPMMNTPTVNGPIVGSNPDMLVAQNLNNTYQQQISIPHKSGFKGIYVFFLMMILCGLGAYIFWKMYPVETENLLTQLGIGGEKLDANVQSITDQQPTSEQIDTSTGNQDSFDTPQTTGTLATGELDISTPQEQILPGITTGNEDNFLATGENPINLLENTGVVLPSDNAIKLTNIIEEAKGFIELGTRVQNTKIKTIGIAVEKKATSLLQNIESGSNIDIVELEKDISNLETNLDKLKTIVNEIPSSSGQSDTSLLSGGEIQAEQLSGQETTNSETNSIVTEQ